MQIMNIISIFEQQIKHQNTEIENKLNSITK